MEHTSHSLQRSAENFFKLRLGSSLVSRHFQGPISPNKLYIRSGNFALQTEIVETLSQVFPGVFSRVVWFRTEMTNVDFSPIFVDDNYGTMFDSSTGSWLGLCPSVRPAWFPPTSDGNFWPGAGGHWSSSRESRSLREGPPHCPDWVLILEEYFILRDV